MSKLLIVESPSKIKPIKKYLGSDYEVMASVGHIRDLPKSKLGVDLNNKAILGHPAFYEREVVRCQRSFVKS